MIQSYLLVVIRWLSQSVTIYLLDNIKLLIDQVMLEAFLSIPKISLSAYNKIKTLNLFPIATTLVFKFRIKLIFIKDMSTMLNPLIDKKSDYFYLKWMSFMLLKQSKNKLELFGLNRLNKEPSDSILINLISIQK